MSEATGRPDYTAMKDGEMLVALGDDAMKWATAFCQFNAKHQFVIDEGLMVGWFAAAIETTSALRLARTTNSHDALVKALERLKLALQDTEACLNTWNGGLGSPANVEGAIQEADAALALARGDGT